VYRLENEVEKRKTEPSETQPHHHEVDHEHQEQHMQHEHNEYHEEHDHQHHGHHGHREHHHAHAYHHGHDHSHGESSRLKRTFSYMILIFPIATGIFMPVQTLDSSFVKAKGFSFPTFEISEDDPGQHQFLKPDTSVYFGPEGYEKVKGKELSEFVNQDEIKLTDKNYLKGMEVIYNFPGDFMGKTISFDGFAYKGEQVDDNHFFIFRFGFIHCVADSGVFGMLVDFPKNTNLKDDEWVRVTGKLTWEMYQPFKQTIPVLKVNTWNTIPDPDDPYVYREF
jgi:putative membrane protein